MKRYEVSTDIAFREWIDEDPAGRFCNPAGRFCKVEDVRAVFERLRAELARSYDPRGALTILDEEQP